MKNYFLPVVSIGLMAGVLMGQVAPPVAALPKPSSAAGPWAAQTVRDQFKLPEAVFVMEEGKTAVSSNSIFAVRIGDSLQTRGAISITTPEGQVLSGQPVALSLYDVESGKNALIAELKPAKARVVSGNQVIFEDCWDNGIQADVVFEVGLESFSQSVLWHSQPPDPHSLGLGKATRVLITS